MTYRPYPLQDMRDVAHLVKGRRRALGMRQPDLAMAANVGVRFIVDVESGKETCQAGLVLRLLAALGVEIAGSCDLEPSRGPDQRDEGLDVDETAAGALR